MGMPGPMLFGGEPPPFLMGLHLSEEQEDKVFAILHAAAPELREHMKAARKAREALHDLGQSPTYDGGKAAALAQSEAAAESQLALLRTRTDHEIYGLLTPEQRARIGEQRRSLDGSAEPPKP